MAKQIHVNQPKKVELNNIKINVRDHKVRNLLHASYKQHATGVGAMKNLKAYDRNRSKKQVKKEIDKYK